MKLGTITRLGIKHPIERVTFCMGDSTAWCVAVESKRVEGFVDSSGEGELLAADSAV